MCTSPSLSRLSRKAVRPHPILLSTYIPWSGPMLYYMHSVHASHFMLYYMHSVHASHFMLYYMHRIFLTLQLAIFQEVRTLFCMLTFGCGSKGRKGFQDVSREMKGGTNPLDSTDSSKATELKAAGNFAHVSHFRPASNHASFLL